MFLIENAVNLHYYQLVRYREADQSSLLPQRPIAKAVVWSASENQNTAGLGEAELLEASFPSSDF